MLEEIESLTQKEQYHSVINGSMTDGAELTAKYEDMDDDWSESVHF